MLTVTEEAGVHLVHLLDQAEASPGVAVRLLRNGKNLAMDMDTEREGDVAVAHAGRTVLLLDDDISRMLDNLTLVVRESDDGPTLALS
jgi:hypothetical protein